MNKTIFLLNIDKYAPKITKLTYPLIEYYADKIGANIVKITKRKYPDYPVTYEKFQIYDLASSDWNIYIDSDTLILPEFFDLTPFMNKGVTYFPSNNIAPSRFKSDKYFLRSGSKFSAPTSFVFTSDWCLDVWKPVDDLSLEQIKNNIYKVPRDFECKKSKIKEYCQNRYESTYFIDDYLVARNIAKYGLKPDYMTSVYEELFNHTDLLYWVKFPLTSIEEKYTNILVQLYENLKYFDWKDYGISKLPDLPEGYSYTPD